MSRTIECRVAGITEDRTGVSLKFVDTPKALIEQTIFVSIPANQLKLWDKMWLTLETEEERNAPKAMEK